MAATKVFLKFPGVAGESTDDKHKGEIEITSFAANASRVGNLNGGGGGGGVGRVICGQVTLVKPIDQSSPKFLGLLFNGAVTRGPAVLSFEKVSGGEGPHIDYYVIELSDISVMGISQSDPDDGVVTEKVMLQAGKYIYSYTPQKPDGSAGTPVTFGWDCRLGRQI